MSCRVYYMVSLLSLVTLTSSKPIMVSFGTNQGPIEPSQPESVTLRQRTIVARNPAPVSEESDDIPNPIQYKPLEPHQYRSKLYSFKPPANLILGTPLDQKFTPNLQKYNSHKKPQARNLNLGVDYTGPHLFEKQDYEIYEAKNALEPPRYNQQDEKRTDIRNAGNSKYVPQIGIIYSAGVRYYIPQISYYNEQEDTGKNYVEENSVYDNHDEKYYN